MKGAASRLNSFFSDFLSRLPPFCLLPLARDWLYSFSAPACLWLCLRYACAYSYGLWLGQAAKRVWWTCWLADQMYQNGNLLFFSFNLNSTLLKRYVSKITFFQLHRCNLWKRPQRLGKSLMKSLKNLNGELLSKGDKFSKKNFK